MQTKTRVAYALASFNEKQSHELYAKKKDSLEKCCKEIARHFSRENLNGATLAVSALYSDKMNITACIYKGRLFVGFQDRETKNIFFNDKTDSFIFMPPSAPEDLKIRMQNTIESFKNGHKNQMSKQLSSDWEKTIPLLDKLVAFEEKIKNLPEDVLHKFRERLLYDECIDVIISTGTGYCPDLNNEIDARISQAFKMAGKSEPEE